MKQVIKIDFRKMGAGGGGDKKKRPTSNKNKDITNRLISNRVRYLPLLFWCVHMLFAWTMYIYIYRKKK